MIKLFYNKTKQNKINFLLHFNKHILTNSFSDISGLVLSSITFCKSLNSLFTDCKLKMYQVNYFSVFVRNIMN